MLGLQTRIERFKHYYQEGTFFPHLYISLFFRIKGLFNLVSPFQKVQKNKIVFSNFLGLGYGCNPKYIAQYIIDHKLPFELVWLVDSLKCKNKELFPEQIRLVEFYSFKALKELSTAAIWIDNVRKSIYPKKKKGQIYIQTWHGTFPTKKIEKDAHNLPVAYQENAIKDSKLIDVLLSGSGIKTETYKSNFYYDGEILNIGQPRDDVFFNEEKIRNCKTKIKTFYKLPQENKIILYAPTFRSNYSLEPYKLDYKMVKESFEKKYNCDCSFIVRLHPNMVLFAENLEIPDFVINATAYPDMQELLCSSDFIISDYSSTLDFSLFYKPIFLFCSDYEDYKINERDFYIQLEDLPFSMAKTNESLCENIAKFDEIEYKEKLSETYKRFCLFDDGHASERVVQWMMQKLEEKA